MSHIAANLRTSLHYRSIGKHLLVQLYPCLEARVDVLNYLDRLVFPKEPYQFFKKQCDEFHQDKTMDTTEYDMKFMK